jgi:hypothetical protein
MKKKIIIEKSELPITSKSGLYLLDFLLDQIDFNRNANRIFGAPGSNRGFAASVFLRTMIHMIADGALALDDVKGFQDDEGYKRMLDDPIIPSSDALGDWLYRQSQITHTNKEAGKKVDEKDQITDNPGEKKIMALIGEHARLSLTKGQRSCLDVDATIYVNDKSDAAWTYQKTRGYSHMMTMLDNPRRALYSQLRPGNISPQEGVLEAIHGSIAQVPAGTIFCIRSDSAAYNHEVINYCFEKKLFFTITADRDLAVKEQIASIKKWTKAVDTEGRELGWEVGETIHTMNKTHHAFRLVVKRTLRSKEQEDLFDPYIYWAVAANLPEEEFSSQAVIAHHEKRGNMERFIGELKWEFNADHLPCQTLAPNAIVVGVMVLTFNLLYHLQDVMSESGIPHRKSIRSLRRYLLCLPAYVVWHARQMAIKIAATTSCVELFRKVYECLLLFNCSPPAC